MFKNKKMIISLVIVAIIVTSFAGTAFAGYSSVSISGGYGTVYGTPSNMSYNITRNCYMSSDSASTYITAYLNYDGSNHSAVRIYQGDNFARSSYVIGTKSVRAVLEAIWGGTHWASHSANG